MSTLSEKIMRKALKKVNALIPNHEIVILVRPEGKDAASVSNTTDKNAVEMMDNATKRLAK